MPDLASTQASTGPVSLVCNRCKAEVSISDGESPPSRWNQDTEGKVEFGDGTRGPKGQWWHKCYEESLGPNWAPATVQG